MLRIIASSCLAFALWGGAFAADDGDLRKVAQTYAAAGMTAMKDSDGEPKRIVDAALSFAEALKIYEKLGDVDAICDMQANVFWCKKKMNIDNLDDYLAKKGGEHKEALATVNAVAEKQVDASEGKAYFDRAEAYAAKNADKPMQVSIRYFEVAERFTGTDLAIRAQRASLEWLQKHMKAIQGQGQAMAKEKEAMDRERETLFTKPRPGNSSAKAEVPPADKQKAGLADLKKIYSADYAKSKDTQKRTFAAKLLKEAKASKDDATLRWCLIAEAVRLGCAVEDYTLVLSAIDLEADTFAGIEAGAEKKAVFGKMPSRTVAKHICTLVDDPKSAEANAVVGRFFASQGGFDLAIPMLALGNDAELKKLADMEMLKPDGAGQQSELGDAWFDLAKKARGTTEKEAFYGRAIMWFQQAEPKLSGISKEKAKQRIIELEKLLPPTIKDWDNVTERQWDALRGGVVQVEAKKERTDTGLQIVPGKKWRVVPHPTDKWTFTAYSGQKSCTWKGTKSGYYYGGGDFAYGALGMWVDNGTHLKPGIIDTAGHLYLGPASTDAYYQYDGTGALRVKIIPADDE